MHDHSAHEALALLETDATRGLTSEEAARRLHRHGANVLAPVAKQGPLVRFLLQFHHPLIYVLLVAAAVTFAVGETVDGSVIMVVVLANAAIGFVQERRAESALDALAQMITVETQVVRDGEQVGMAARELVPGDLVRLFPGDKVSADLRLIELAKLQIDESALTGESVPVNKAQGVLPEATGLGDRKNMAFSGTLVTAGEATGVVVATGEATELGLIHRMLGSTSDLTTPLTLQLNAFSRLLTVVILGLAAVTFGIGLLRGEPAAEMLVAAVALAVGAIPEGLPAAVTIALAIGVGRMARRSAIVRRLPAVETLGGTTVICTDKTGTLTQNAMTVQTVIVGDRRYEVDGGGYTPEGAIRIGDEEIAPEDHPAFATCLLAGTLCGDGDIRARDDGWEPIGDPMEAALVVSAAKAGMPRAQTLEAWPRTDVLAFDSERMYMATIHDGPDGRVVFVKGALERLLGMCDRQLAPVDTGAHAPLDHETYQDAVAAFGRDGQRVLAFATRRLDADEPFDLEQPAGLAFIGLQALVDPPRPEAISAVAACRRAGVDVKMITGDHAATAAAIAARVGITDGGEPRVVTGAQLAETSDEDLIAVASSTNVFARVSAEQKVRIVEALQAHGEIVAMTGDGVNDAPALRKANIGVAMGQGGTEVAREAADIVLTNDNFASIEAAVEEGRHTFDNLKKFIVWTVPTNMAEGLLIVLAIAIGATLPILPVQILWINMTTAVLLGLPLAFERAEPGIMDRPPRPPSDAILTTDVVTRILLVSALLLGAAFWLFEREQARGSSIEESRTVAMNVFVAVQILYLLSCRSMVGRARDLGWFTNRWLVYCVALMIALQLILTYWPPMNDLFGTAPVEAEAWLRILAVAAGTWLVVEAEKALRRRRLRLGRS